jgi:SOS-response transcriptional repressor LexA
MSDHDRKRVPPRRSDAPAHPAGPDAASDADLDDPEVVAGLEALTDPQIDLVGHAERLHPDSPAYDDPRFLAWLAREHADDPELLDADEIRALARRIVAGVSDATFGVRLVDRAPEVRAIAPGAVSAIVDERSARREAAVLDLSVAAGAGRALWDAECESCTPLPDGVPSGRYLALRVAGKSMEPLMHPGDVVLVRLGSELVPDSIVVARLPDDGYVVKRVGRVARRSVELLSLNPAFAPIQAPRTTHAVLGTVVLRWCDHVSGA